MNKFIFSFILLATFFISCGKDSGTNDPNNPNGNGGEQPTLTLSLTELTFKSAGEEKTFTITSNSNWTITNPSTWCKIDPIQGNSNFRYRQRGKADHRRVLCEGETDHSGA